MRSRTAKSSKAIAGSDRRYGYIAMLQPMKLQPLKLQMVCVVSQLLSDPSLLGKLLVVSVVSIILLRSSG